MVAEIGIITVYLMTTSRILFALSFDRILPGGIRSLSRWGTPGVAIGATALSIAVMFALAIFTSVLTVWSNGTLGLAIIYVLISLAVVSLVYRHRQIWESGPRTLTQRVFGVPLIVYRRPAVDRLRSADRGLGDRQAARDRPAELEVDPGAGDRVRVGRHRVRVAEGVLQASGDQPRLGVDGDPTGVMLGLRSRGSRKADTATRRLRLFYCGDIHGSDVCFRKFINAGAHYETDVLILGGDITGKALVPIVRLQDGSWRGHLHGQERLCQTEEDVAQLRDAISRAGFYPVEVTRRGDGAHGDQCRGARSTASARR